MLESIKKWWDNLPRFQKFLIGGAGALFLISLMIVGSIGRKDPQLVVLYSELSLKDAGNVASKLKEMKVPYKLTDGGATVLVPQSEVYETRINLAAENIPKGGVVGYEIFDKTHIGMTDFVEKINYKRALEGELVRSICALDEVEDARAHIVLPEEKLFEEDKRPPTCSVILKLRSGAALRESQVRGIAHLIASSVEGLNPQNITILDYFGNMLHSGITEGADNDPVVMSTQQFQAKRDVEKYLAHKAQSILERAIGVGNVIVKVDADINFTNVVKTVEKYDPEGQVIRSREYYSDGKVQQSSITNYEISRTIEEIVNKSGNIKKFSASVLVNGVYELAKEKGKNVYKYTSRTNEELRKFRELAKNAVGYDEARGDRVEVITVPFGAPPLPLPKPRAYSTLSNLRNIVTALRPIIIFIIIIIVIFLVIRHLLPLLKTPPKKIGVKESAIPEPDEAKGEKLELMKESLSKRAIEHPDEVATVIKKFLKE